MSSLNVSNHRPPQQPSPLLAQDNPVRSTGLRGISALFTTDGFVHNDQESSAPTSGGPLTRECSSGSESGESANQSSTLSHTAPPNNLCQILPPLDAARATASRPLHRTLSQLGESGNDDVRAVSPRTFVPQDRLSVESLGDESVGHRRVRQGDPSAVVFKEEIRKRDAHEEHVCVVVNSGILFYTLKLQ